MNNLQGYVVRQIEFNADKPFSWHKNLHNEFVCANMGAITVHVNILNQKIERTYSNGDWVVIPAGVEHVITQVNDSIKSFLLIEHEDDVG